ncbi:MAG: efflux RND transporter periplasmic adaptor subunit [Leptolyngbyaceae cyanobacterium bins.349]|nr:efflux RND transporter periplasmic adaptor subunit [Leptolyngbyaceae cyanobacterium bins.349]
MTAHSSLRFLSLLFASCLLLSPVKVVAHPGHGDHEFEATGTAGTPAAVQVDRVTGDRLGIRVAPVSRQRFSQGIPATGQIEALPDQQVRVTAPLTGTVVRLLVKPGDRVQQGQALAVLTSPDLAGLRTEALDRQTTARGAIQTAEAELRLAQRNYQRQGQIANAAIQQAETEFKVAQERYTRDRELLAQGAIPNRTVLESEAHLSVARAALTQAKSQLSVSDAAAQVEKAKSAVQVAQSQLQLSGDNYQTRLRQLNVSSNQEGLVTIKAPISGIIADLTITTGESVTEPGVPLMAIVNGNGVWATANVYEKDLSRVAPGQQVRVSVTGVKEAFTGAISYIGAAVKGEVRVVPVKAELANPDGVLKPGMFARLEILTGQTTETVLAVPTAAIANASSGQPLVYVKNGQNYEPISVQLGRVDGDLTEITNGLFEGDQVVVQGAPLLYAQSLRGGNSPKETPASENSPQSSSAAVPWWMVAGGGAIALSTFAAGLGVATYRQRKGMGNA